MGSIEMGHVPGFVASEERRRAVMASIPVHDRRTRSMRALERMNLDGLVAVGTQYAAWLAGYHRYSGSLSATLLGSSGEIEVVASADEAPVVEATSAAGRVHTYGERGFGFELDPVPSLLAALHRVRTHRGRGRLGVAGVPQNVVAQAVSVALIPVDTELAAIMSVKDLDELEKIARSYELCMQAQTVVRDGVDGGASELELFTRAHAAAQLAAGQPVEFIADVLAGANSAQVSGPVAVAGSRRPADGEPVLSDILVRADGYWGDTCRTHVRGRNDEVEGVLTGLTSILEKSATDLRPGAEARDLYRSMSARLREAFPHSSSLPHHAGHGIGIDPVERPNLSPTDDTLLEAGMVVALEPGVYSGAFGVRHENDYLVTSAGGVELAAAMDCLGGRHELPSNGTSE